MPSHRELALETIERLQDLLAELDHVCGQAAELSAQITAQLNEHAHAIRPAKSNARTPERRLVKRATR